MAAIASTPRMRCLYVFNRDGVCLHYHVWLRPLTTLSPHQDQKLMFGLLFSLKSFTAKMDPVGFAFFPWPSMCLCARVSIRCFSSSHARVCNNFFSPVLIKPYARFLTLPNLVNCNSSGNKGNLGAPNLPGQGCSFHSFRTNTYKLSFMESPSGIKV